MGESKIIGPDGIDIANANIGETLISAELQITSINYFSFYWQDELSIPQGINVLHRKAPSKIASLNSAPLKLALVKLA